MNNCIFCRIASGQLPCDKIHETNDFLAFMDIRPVNIGHALVIPKKHCKDILDFPKTEETDFVEFVKKTAKAIVAATNADGFNLGMNNGEAAGQTVFHSHMHIIPRFIGDGLEMWHPKEAITKEDISKLKDKIIINLK